MNYILFDDNSWNSLRPLTFTRPVSEIRIGILTITEKWNRILEQPCSYFTQPYLQEKYKCNLAEENIFINGSIIPNESLASKIKSLPANGALFSGQILIAVNLGKKEAQAFSHSESLFQNNKIEYDEAITNIQFPWNIFTLNGKQIEADYELIVKDRKSAPISKTNQIAGAENIFLEEGAKVEFSILNASEGYIYIGKDAEIMEGSIVRGSLALCEHSALKMGAKIYGPTTVGPHSKVGGEVNNSVIFGYSNKGHDGFLGNSVLGEWCNLGADTNNSNLKNNYAEVKVWSYDKKSFTKTGLQFCGLIMGDHSKCGINTMFNTGTVVGVSANIFGSGFPRNFVPCFSWGGAAGFSVYTLPKVFETAKLVMERRGIPLDDVEKNIITHIFNETEQFRNF